MTTKENKEALLIKDYNNGLIMRYGTTEDAQALAEFNGEVHKDEDEERSDYCYYWTYDLATKDHPTFDVSDFIIIEDSATGKIVSTMNLINQTWSYGGIKFPVGRPELVGTLKEYRRRGLVREMFDIAHKISDERGHMLQGITGIPWYYRLFDYDMALNLEGGCHVHKSKVVKLKKEEKEKYTFRLAEKKDLNFIMKLYNASCKRSLVACEWDQALWEYELFTRWPVRQTAIIEDLDGNKVGYVTHNPVVYGPRLGVRQIEVAEGVCLMDVLDSVLRYLVSVGEKLTTEKKDETAAFEFMSFDFGAEHPLYEFHPYLFTDLKPPYAWFIRIPHLVGFLNHIKPVLQKRLADSVVRNWSGDLSVSMFKNGFKITIEKGNIKTIEEWKPERVEQGDALFPDLTFYQLLLGYRSLKEMTAHYADCYVPKKRKWAVLNALFPKENSDVVPIS